MNRFADALGPLAKSGGMALPIPPGISAIESSEGTPIEGYGPQLVLGKDDTLSLQGRLLRSIDELGNELALTVEMARASGRTEPLYIWVDQASAAARVASILAVVPAGMEARLVLVGPEPSLSEYERELLDIPRVQTLRQEIDDLDPADKATTLAQRMQVAVGSCAPLMKAFGSVASTDGTSKAEYMAKAAPEALRACACEVADLEFIEYTLLAIMGAFDRPLRSIPASEAASVLGP